MPIKVKRDVKPTFGLPHGFSLGDTPVLDEKGKSKGTFRKLGGQYRPVVKGPVADRNWSQFENSWKVQGLSSKNTKREVIRAIARKFNLDQSEEPIFQALWSLTGEADKFHTGQKNFIDLDLGFAYGHAAVIAQGGGPLGPTFSRIRDRADVDKLVVFSDHHMTAFKRKPNFFADFNYQLYLDVLEHYAARDDFCLVENGDLEECIIYEPTLADARMRESQLARLPITLEDDEWAAFLRTRYKQRQVNQTSVITAFSDYYKLLREKFIPDDRYVRITGNHDTYLDEEHERVLRDRIQDELGIEVLDILRVARSGPIEYVIMHGHQFDSVSSQNGDTPWAKSLGEVYSECVSWAFQGPDRFWTTQDTQKWYVGAGTYPNNLAVEEAKQYQGRGWEILGDGVWDLLTSSLDRIKEDDEAFIETLLGHQIAWGYFENLEAFRALTLETWTGEELYKLRHLDEVTLCREYEAEFRKSEPHDPIPTLVLGHTHEPRHNARDPKKGDHPPYYMNSGSAGRYENLLWCVEIHRDDARICSWSRVNGKLRKIPWEPNGDTLGHDAGPFEEF
jgi:UDP-2,3-diacylglucosamine pyrophosphatase LpxH